MRPTPALLLLVLLTGCLPGQAAPAATPTPSPTPLPAATPPPTAAPSPTSAPEGGGGGRPSAAETDTPELLTLRLVIDPERTVARYRVQEQLAALDFPSDAVGSTRAVSGQVVLRSDGTLAPADSQIVVDLRTLRSDESRRDNYIQGRTLDTGSFPSAVFVPREARGLGSRLAPGPFDLQLTGELTIRGVTREVTWEVSGEATEEEVRGLASTRITFQDFGLERPRVAVVLSVEETIRLELDFVLLAVE